MEHWYEVMVLEGIWAVLVYALQPTEKKGYNLWRGSTVIDGQERRKDPGVKGILSDFRDYCCYRSEP